MGFPNNMFGGGGMFQGGPTTTPSWNGDFSGNLNDILAPYKQMAAQYTSPYATMRPNSWLAQNHPQLAGVLDNAFLSAAMTPGPQGPEGVGGGISRTFQGLLGANQYRRQQMIQGAMLPYQMGMQQVQMQDTLSQIKEREAMAPYYRARSDWYEGRLEQANNPRYVPGSYKTDDKGNNWQEIFDPVAGTTRLFNPTSQKHADELPPEQQPSFNKEKKVARQSGMSLPERMVDDEDRSRVASGKPPMDVAARNNRIMALNAQMYGQRVQQGQDVTQPVKNLETTLKNERAAAYNALPKTMSPSEFKDAHMLDVDYWDQKKGGPAGAYDRYLKTQQAAKQQLDVDINKYGQSSAPGQGISFPAYMQDRNSYDGTPPNPAPTPASNSGSNWSPK